MRIKFPEQADKFMESEIDLNQALQVIKDTIKTFCLLKHKLPKSYCKKV